MIRPLDIPRVILHGGFWNKFGEIIPAELTRRNDRLHLACTLYGGTIYICLSEIVRGKVEEFLPEGAIPVYHPAGMTFGQIRNWLRSLMSGIFWMSDGDPNEFRLIIGKGKSYCPNLIGFPAIIQAAMKYIEQDVIKMAENEDRPIVGAGFNNSCWADTSFQRTYGQLPINLFLCPNPHLGPDFGERNRLEDIYASIKAKEQGHLTYKSQFATAMFEASKEGGRLTLRGDKEYRDAKNELPEKSLRYIKRTDSVSMHSHKRLVKDKELKNIPLEVMKAIDSLGLQEILIPREKERVL
jgi:hypothetical protein